MSKKSKIKPQSDFRKDDKCGCTRFDGRRVEDEDVRRAIRDFLHQEHARLPRPPEDLQTLQHFRERVDRCWCQLQQHGSLEERLSGACDYLQDEIVWETGTGERVIYRGWTDQQKDRIDELFQLLLENRRDLGLRCPDPSRNYPRNMRPGGLTANMFFTAEEAFDIYAAHVAHVFYIEATQAVPWSIFFFFRL